MKTSPIYKINKKYNKRGHKLKWDNMALCIKEKGPK